MCGIWYTICEAIYEVKDHGRSSGDAVWQQEWRDARPGQTVAVVISRFLAVARHTAQGRPTTLLWAGVVVHSTSSVIVAASSVDGAGFSLLRLLLGLPVLCAAAWLSGDTRAPAQGSSAVAWTLVAGLAFAGHQLLFMTAVKLTSVADVVLMNTLAPFIVMLLAVPLFGERPRALVPGWIGLAIAGAAIVAIAGSTGPSGHGLGMVLAALNVVVFSLFFVASKAARPHISVWPFLFVTVGIATVCVGGLFLLAGWSFPAATRIDWVLAFLVAVGPGAMGHFLMTWPLESVPAFIPPLLRLAQPFFAAGLAWVILSQPVTIPQIAGGALTLGGVAGALRVGVVVPRTEGPAP